jgi:hypothetical protein
MALVWEKVPSQFVNGEHLNGYETLDPVLLYRARVPGGWLLVRGLPSQAGIINFYPDPCHDWNRSSAASHPRS